ncbi:hypothetical protein QE450_003949 [Paenibacillus sp. SORGH_AS306]|uniref:hypothetical protein n=1 Tax=unclassified Paenibacillus TaxID=185978 RepID=UPI0027858075|nr:MULTISPECIES: hypothetical protein [unclassified Paenibacillus]MDQ1236451.1 hypothetical protein [Paenibacillus sp. SORGH_AS_0306]MDR6108804.1 hypothetical protein [Paenibacillus sp. SORGH_AS_0338]
MSWKHIVMEANCFYEDSEDNHDANCCKGKIGIHCLTYNQDGYQICPNLVFGKSRSSVVATDKEGFAVDYSTFWTDEKLSPEEWIRRETLWLEEQKKLLKMDNK